MLLLALPMEFFFGCTVVRIDHRQIFCYIKNMDAAQNAMHSQCVISIK